MILLSLICGLKMLQIKIKRFFSFLEKKKKRKEKVSIWDLHPVFIYFRIIN